MELFAGMKNVPKQNVKTEIQEILQQVQLDHVRIDKYHMTVM